MRAFVATKNNEEVTAVFEGCGFESIPLTTEDSILDNIRSLETCSVVVVDADSPTWVFREANEHYKIIVAFMSIPHDVKVTAMVLSYESLGSLLVDIEPISCKMVPVDEKFANQVAMIKARYPVVITGASGA